MSDTSPAETREKGGLLRSSATYLAWWCLFGVVAGSLMPVVSDDGAFWAVKSQQATSGLIFGLLCAVVFTLAQNALNQARKRWLSRLLVFSVWMGMKFAMYGIGLATLPR